MIRYALCCERGHDFESWFRDSASYDVQARRGLVSCPVCQSTSVAKQIMAPAVARTDRERPPAPVETEDQAAPETPAAAPSVPMVALSEREIAFRALLRAVRDHVTATAEHVGPRFAEEARRMHEGLSEFRAIYGEATEDEARALADEGIEAFPLPILPDDRH
ncbi:MAG: DUF1178 family protein [Alsobacter sp.]